MKKFIAAALSMLLVFSLAACNKGTAPASSSDSSSPGQNGSQDQPATATGYKIGLSINALDEFQTEWLGYFQEYLESLGHTLTVTNADSKVDKQLADVESLIQMGLDVICIKSVDQEGVVPCFEACEKAGIPSVDVDMGANTDIPLHVKGDQREHGVVIGQYANEWLEQNPGETIRAGYIIGVETPSVIGRRDGWLDTMDEAGNKDRYTLLAEKVCNWSATEAMAVVEDWMQAYPDMNWIVAMSDEMAIAAVNVVEAAGKTGQVVICGVDGSPNAQKHIREGTMTGSSFIPRKQQAISAADYILKVCGGDLSLLGQNIDIGSGLYAFLTKENIDAELGKYD